MDKIRLGFAFTGSFCTFERVMRVVEELAATGSYDIFPIMSEASANTDTRFGTAASWRERFAAVTGKDVICTISGAEPIGPKKLLDVLAVAPCTGNTLAKLAHGITDSAVTMAVKAQLRNERPVVLAVSTNDALTTAARNIGELMARRHYVFVPMEKDDPIQKPASMVAKMEELANVLSRASQG